VLDKPITIERKPETEANAGARARLDFSFVGSDLDQVVRCEVTDAKGRARSEYSRVVLAPKGRGRLTISLAVNDPKGKWTVLLTHILTGARIEGRLVVR